MDAAAAQDAAGARVDGGARDATSPVVPPRDAGVATAPGATGVPKECFGLPLPDRARTPSTGAPASLAPYFPTTSFRTVTPEMAGMDSAKLAAALEFSTPTSATDGIIVLRNGNIVAERYYGSFTETTLHDSFSVAKSFTSTLVAIAKEQGLLETLDQKLCSYYPAEWDCEAASDPRSRITIQHAMNLTTSLQWDEDWRGGVVTVNDTVLGVALGMVSYVLGKPAQGEPGGAQRYSTGDPALLTQVIQEVSGDNALAFARKNLFAPLGISSVEWSSDGSARTNTFAGLRLAVRDYAKLGVLYENEGMWEGKRLLPEGWTSTLSTGHSCSDVYKNLFHVNAPVRLGTAKADCERYPFCERTSLANLPADGFFASGLSGQYIFVFPSADLVVARFAADSGGSEDWVGYSRGMLERVFDSMLP